VYNLQQQAFAVSMLSNGVAGVENSDQPALEKMLAGDIAAKLGSSIFTDNIGTWKTIWGPAVYVYGKDISGRDRPVADTAMYAAQNQSTNDIVVGIAGTNPVSRIDIALDLDVGDAVPFTGAPAGALVAFGTLSGINILERMVDPSSGETLLSFLNGLAPTNANLIFSGHSLGGALAPVFALDLLVNHGLTSSNFSNVFTYPTAGPTPGNAAFASFYATKFAAGTGSGWQVWNQNVCNTIDAVPHAWNLLDGLPTLYASIGAVSCVKSIVDKKLTPLLKGNVYAAIQNSSFAGTFNSDVSQPFTTTICKFASQAIYQHIEAYLVEIIPALAGQFASPSFTNDACGTLRLYCFSLG
jgi:hypothetical protein